MSKSKVSFKNVFHTYVWPKRKAILIGLFLITLSRLAGLVMPASTKYLLDDVIDKNNLDLLWPLISVVFTATVLQSTASFLLTRLLSVEAQYLIAELRTKVQKHVLSLPVSFFDSHKSGALVSRVMSDVEGVRNIVGTGLVQLVGGTLTALVSFILLVNIDIWMTIFAIGPMLIFALISTKAFSYIRPVFRERRKVTSEVTGRLTETFNGVRVIKGFNAEAQELLIFERGVLSIFQLVKKSMTSTALVTSSSSFLMGVASCGIMGIGGYLAVGGSITTGEFISFTVFLGFMVAPIVQMSNIGSQLTEAFAGLDRTEELLQMSTEKDDKKRKIILQDVKGDVKFNQVYFEYEKDQEVLTDISFEAPAGTVTALVGTSGSGKSTIASLAASFLNPKSGKITLDEMDMSEVTLESFRRQLGVVLQDDFLFEGSIRENILFSRPKASDEDVQNAVKAAYVDEFVDRFEEGVETVIGERGVKLSGGQRQRVAIARAILANPKILILDEATSNLDTESERYIQKSLDTLMKGKTVFVIAHRLSTIRKADQILVVEQGQIVERGNHDELIAAQGRYYELYTYQARI